MNILWFGRTGQGNAWYHVSLTTFSDLVKNVYVVRYKKPGREIKSNKVRFFETGESPNFVVSIVKLMKRAHRVVRENTVDVVVCFNVFPYGVFAYLLALIYRKKLALCFIGSDYNYYFKTRPYRFFIIQVLRGADLVICKGRYMLPELLSVGIRKERIHLYPHFVSNEFFVECNRQAKCYDIINVSDFLAIKRLDVLIKAVSLLKERRVFMKVCLVGDGPERDNLVKLSESLGVREQVTFTGYQINVAEYLSCSRIYVQTSEREALSLSLVESIAAGLVPVCTEAGAERDIINHDVNGVFTGIGDECDLAEKLEYVNEADVYERLQANSKRTAAELTIERAGRAMDGILGSFDLTEERWEAAESGR